MTTAAFELNDNNEVDDDKIVYKREWLNDDEGTAYVVLNAHKYSSGASIDVDVEIKDCHRQINLDFWFGDEDERKTKLAKMDRLIALLSEAREIIAHHPLKQKTKTVVEEIITAPGLE